MNFNLKDFEEFLHVQYKVILLRNNTVALLCTFANTSRFICTLVTLGKGKGIEMVSVQDFSGVYKRFSFLSCFFSSSLVQKSWKCSSYHLSTEQSCKIIVLYMKKIKTLRNNYKLKGNSCFCVNFWYSAFYWLHHICLLNNGPVIAVDWQYIYEYYF